MRNLFLVVVLSVIVTSAFAQPTVTFESTNVPIPIPDGPVGIAESIIQIEPWYRILDVNVVLTITHTFDRDLRIYLDGPHEDPDEDDDIVRLAYECGQSGDNYVNTRFDDEASLDICDGAPPFTGTFRPDRSLSLLDGMLTHGTWILRVTDNGNGDTGVIQSWRMEIQADTNVSANEPPLAVTFAVGQNYPNPFNATTILPLELGYPSIVKLTVYSLDGRTVQQSLIGLTAGHHNLPIDGSAWSTGSYFAEVIAGRNKEVVRILLLK